MTSTTESPRRSSSAVRRAAVITHGKPQTIGPALERLGKVASEAGVELLLPDEEVAKHGVGEPQDVTNADIAVVLGGDGTMLRALQRFLGTEIPVLGVNFGRVGFLASIMPERLEEDLARVFAGEYRTIEQPTLEARLDGEMFVAVNDVVATSSTLGRMIELGWAIAHEDLGVVSCDGMICSTPSGSTAYNLSNGGPVLVRGLDAMAITFIAPHSLEARPLVVPRGAELTVRNATPDVGAAVLVDGHRAGDLAPEGALSIRLGEQRSLLATLPETTFFGRYRETFTS